MELPLLIKFELAGIDTSERSRHDINPWILMEAATMGNSIDRFLFTVLQAIEFLWENPIQLCSIRILPSKPTAIKAMETKLFVAVEPNRS